MITDNDQQILNNKDFNNNEKRMVMLIVRLGEIYENVEELNKNINTMSSLLVNETDQDLNLELVLQVLCCCIFELPGKQYIYALLTAKLSLENYEFSAQLLQLVSQKFHDLLATFCTTKSNIIDFIKLKNTMTYFAELVKLNVLLVNCFIEVINSMVSIIQNNLKSINRNSFLLELILYGLINCSKELGEKCPDELLSILQSILQLIETLKTKNLIKKKYEILFDILKNEKDNNFENLSKLDIYSSLDNLDLTELNQLELNNSEHMLSDNNSIVAINYMLVNQINLNRDYSENNKQIVEFIIEDKIADIIYIFEKNRKEGIRLILSLKNMLLKSSLDQPQNLFEKCLINCIFDLTTNCYSYNLKPIHICSIMFEIIKSHKDNKSIVEKIENKISDLVLSHTDTLNIVQLERLWLTYSMFINNMEFKFESAKFDQLIDSHLSNYDYRKIFVVELLFNCIKLSYYERIEDFLSNNLKHLIASIEPKLFLDAVDPELSNSLIESIIHRIKDKESQDDLSNYINNLDIEKSAQDHQNNIIVTMVYSIILIGHKSFSHLQSVIEKYSTLLKKILNGSINQKEALTTIDKICIQHPQWLQIVVDRLIQYNILEPSVVIEWLFSHNLESYYRAFYFESLFMVVDRVSKAFLFPDSNENQNSNIPNSDTQQHLKTLLVLVLQKFNHIYSSIFEQNINSDEIAKLSKYFVQRFSQFIQHYHLHISNNLVTIENIVINEAHQNLVIAFNEFKTTYIQQ